MVAILNRILYAFPLLRSFQSTAMKTNAKTRTKIIEIGNGMSSNAISWLMAFFYLRFPKVKNGLDGSIGFEQ